jgi:hypothetical protein
VSLHPVSKIEGTWVRIWFAIVSINDTLFNIFRTTISVYLNIPGSEPFLDHFKCRGELEVRKGIALEKVYTLWESIVVFNYIGEICVRLTTDIWESLYLRTNWVWTFVIDPD